MRSERVFYLDLIKAISIVFVVFCHYTTLNNDTFIGNIVMLIAWAAVPMFFMVSGIVNTLSKSWSWKKWGIRFSKTYIVLCFWKLIYLVAFVINKDLIVSKSEIVQYIFFFGAIEGVSDGVLWFMYAYLEVMLLSPVLWYLWNGKSESRSIFCS